jgi:hypothetical protein
VTGRPAKADTDGPLPPRMRLATRNSPLAIERC